jgi:PAP2 superfamily
MIKKAALAVVATAALTAPAMASADVVTDWNRTMVQALEIAKTPPPPAMRVGAIVQSAVFDAVNGIARRYTKVHVPPAAPRGASEVAAAASAAHEALLVLFPAQQAMLDQQLAATLAQTRGSDRSIASGVQWGKSVADQIVAWRATDGFTTDPGPYVPAGIPGRWQPTPPGFGPPLFRQFAGMTPFALTSPAQFLPAPPPPLNSEQYAHDFNEVKVLGSANSTVRTSEQTQTAVFWQADTPAAIWNRVADDLATQHDGAEPSVRERDDLAGPHDDGSVLRNARILALMNIALADATIAIWNAKNTYDRWRPITAIEQADVNTNPDTTPDPTWTPLIVTPAFQEYPAGHPGVSNAAASVLATIYGDRTAFTATSFGLPGVERNFTSFSSAVEQVENARVWGGIHFRFSTLVGARMGGEVAGYVTSTQIRRDSSSAMARSAPTRWPA